MTKALYPSPGQIRLTLTVTSFVNGRKFVTKEVGTNSTNNIAKNYRNERLIRNAKLNAIYHHMHKGGKSGAHTEIIDFDFNYYDDDVIRKKVKRKDGRTKKEQFYAEVRRKSDKKLIGRRKWTEAKKI